MGLADFQRVEYAHRVIGPHLEVIALLGLLGLPVAALVVVDAAKLAAEQRRHRREVKVPKAGPMDLQHRLTLAADLVPEPRALDVDVAASHASPPVWVPECLLFRDP